MKKLGQHFLVDYPLLDRLVDYGQVSKKDIVLEVGTGTGELTWRLAEKAGKVLAIEIDEKLIEETSRKLNKYNNVELINGDILKIKHKIRGFNKVVSNPPYQISTKLMHWLITNLPERIVLTLQKDFVRKITSPPGSKKYVYTSFLANLFYKCEIVEDVPRNLFKPMPKVDSAVILMKRIDNQIMPREEELNLIKILFTQKRKKLRNVIASISEKLQLDLREVEDVFPVEVLDKRIYHLQPITLYECIRTISKLKSVISNAEENR